MRKQTLSKRLSALLLAALLLLSVLPASAAGADTVYIDSARDFAAFAENCALDSWSVGKTVVLRADISLANVDYTPAASFGGTFDGGGHTISDLNLTGSYSPAGLFGTIEPTGCVTALNVTGCVAPGGDQTLVGGIAGKNSGKIVRCSFSGVVQGQSQTGGLVGCNEADGEILSSSFSGTVQATNATGGIAGRSSGVIRRCTNSGSVNTASVDAALSLSDLHIDLTLDLASLTSRQTLLTTTATGGVAGYNTGIVSGCTNEGTIGYEHVGYNVGGIAGSTSGYLLNCENTGAVYGRKDVGGIAGQALPYIAIEVSESTKEQLQRQLQELKTLTDKATADAGGAASGLGSQLAGMGSYLDSAAYAADNLRATASLGGTASGAGGVTGGASLEIGEGSAGAGGAIGAGSDTSLDVSMPPLSVDGSHLAGAGAGVGGYIDPSDVSLSGGTDGSGTLNASLQLSADASLPGLSSALSGMGAQMRAIGSQTAALSETLQTDLQAVSDKLDEISTTVFDAMDAAQSGDLISDTSAQDPEAVTLGAVRGCKNRGAVQADRNVGGITGAMALEYDADPESDVSESLSTSERKQYELRAVLQRCVNEGDITAKKDCAAAVCGRMDLGLIDGCESYGSAESRSGSYVGGVAGICGAAIRNSFAKCALAGGSYVGGIAGAGVTDSLTGGGSLITGCVSLVTISRCEQYAGAIAGSDAGSFAQNRFVSDTLAGLDGRSVAGQAEPVTYQALMQDESLPDALRAFTVKFVADGAVVKTVSVQYGDALPDDAYPAIPAKDGQYGVWEPASPGFIHADTTVTAVYHASIDALPSDAQRGDGRPVFLAEGTFTGDDTLQAQPQAITPTAFGELSASVPEAIRKYVQNIADGHAPAARVAKSVIEQWQLRIPDDGTDTHTLRYRAPDGQSGGVDIYLMDADGVWRRAKTGESGSYLTFTAAGQTVRLAVLSTFPVWWVWIVLAVLAALLVLLILHLAHRRGKARRKQMQALQKAMQDEQNANDAAIGVIDPGAQPDPVKTAKKKKIRRVWLIVLAALLVLAVAGTLIYRASLKSSVDALLLLKNLTEKAELDTDASVRLELGDETLRTDAHLFHTTANGSRILCIEENGVLLYYYDGAVYLENGSAYRTSGVFPDYSTLGEHLITLYKATDVTYARENGEAVYSVTARGENAQKSLELLAPSLAADLSKVDAIDLCMHVQDGEITSIEASGSCEAVSNGQTQPLTVWAELTVQQTVSGAHTVPQAVLDAIENGGYQGKLELTEDLLRIISAMSELGERDPLCADVTLRGSCGPIVLDTQLSWFRRTENGRTAGCIRAGSVPLYYRGETVLTEDGRTPAASEQALVRCADLVDIAYRACLEDGAGTSVQDGVYTYTLALSSDRTQQIARAIAPESEKLDVQYLPGSVTLTVENGRVTRLAAAVEGTVHVGLADTGASLSATFNFRDDLTADDCRIPQSILDALA